MPVFHFMWKMHLLFDGTSKIYAELFEHGNFEFTLKWTECHLKFCPAVGCYWFIKICLQLLPTWRKHTASGKHFTAKSLYLLREYGKLRRNILVPVVCWVEELQSATNYLSSALIPKMSHNHTTKEHSPFNCWESYIRFFDGSCPL